MFQAFFKIFIFICLIVPYFSHAEIIVSEVMYDLEGSDTGNEWLEILNTGSSAVTINDYHFYEAGVHHGLNNESIINLASGEYAVIVQDIDGFISRYGSGNKLLKSSFSLSNTVEELAISDGDKNIVYSISYDSSFGGQSNGNSLSYGGDGWFQSTPTPGSDSASNIPVVEASSSSSSSNAISNTKDDENNTARSQKQEIEYFNANISTPSFGLTHSDISIKAYVNHVEGLKTTKQLRGIYYLSFGDGNFLESDIRYDIYYQYKYSGVYTLALEYYESSLSKEIGEEPDAFVTKDIVIHEPFISIIDVDNTNGITIKNELNTRIDLYKWNLSINNQVFTFPKYSFIGPNRQKIIPSNIHGLPIIYNKDWVILRNEHDVTISSFTKDSMKMNFARGEITVSETMPIENFSLPPSLGVENNTVLSIESTVPPEDASILSEDFNMRYLSQHPNKVLVGFNESTNIPPITRTDGDFPLYIIIVLGILSLFLVGVRAYQKNNKPTANNTDIVVGDIELI